MKILAPSYHARHAVFTAPWSYSADTETSEKYVSFARMPQFSFPQESSTNVSNRRDDNDVGISHRVVRFRSVRCSAFHPDNRELLLISDNRYRIPSVKYPTLNYTK